MTRKPEKGLFIVFEGCEGAGKSSQSHALKGRLTSSGYRAIITCEPGGTVFGQEMARVIGGRSLPSLTELLLFAAARAQHVIEVVEPALGRGEIVVCDRYVHSSLAYQGYGRGLPLNHVRAVNHVAGKGILPDLVVLLDVPVEVGLTRKGKPVDGDRIGSEGVEFHRRVREGYLALAKEEADRFLVVDGALPAPEVEGRIWTFIQDALTARTASPKDAGPQNGDLSKK